MKKVYENLDYSMVGHFQSILESEGIRTEIRNEGGVGLAGEVPFTQVYPELWVLEDRDRSKAEALIERYLSELKDNPVGPSWTCPSCHAEVEGQFSECWNCGTPAPEST